MGMFRDAFGNPIQFSDNIDLDLEDGTRSVMFLDCMIDVSVHDWLRLRKEKWRYSWNKKKRKKLWKRSLRKLSILPLLKRIKILYQKSLRGKNLKDGYVYGRSNGWYHIEKNNESYKRKYPYLLIIKKMV